MHQNYTSIESKLLRYVKGNMQLDHWPETVEACWLSIKRCYGKGLIIGRMKDEIRPTSHCIQKLIMDGFKEPNTISKTEKKV